MCFELMKKTILILAANPKNTAPLRLDEEVREIDAGLRQAKHRDRFNLIQRWAVRPLDLRRALLDCEPEIVHFAGHGAGEAGIQLEDPQGNSIPVSSEALAELFGLFPRTECVLLNACYTEIQANAIVQHVEYVIGTRQAISDKSAIEFAVGFYDAIGAGKPCDFAYKLGCVALNMTGANRINDPVLKTKKGFLEFLKTHDQTPVVEDKLLRLISPPPPETDLRPLSTANIKIPTDDELLQALLGDELRRSKKTCDLIVKLGRTKFFQNKLLNLFNTSPVSYKQRFAIGRAFSFIGDPRNLEEMVLIPG